MESNKQESIFQNPLFYLAIFLGVMALTMNVYNVVTWNEREEMIDSVLETMERVRKTLEESVAHIELNEQEKRVNQKTYEEVKQHKKGEEK